jgi:hypothetical protein
MKYISRPTPITTILNTISVDAHSETAELESYIANLEAKQQGRPSRISEILSVIGSQYSVDVQAILEEYISNLEAKQPAAMPSNEHKVSLDLNNPPVWSHQRTLERERNHKEHALAKQAIVNSEHRGQG